MPGYLPSCPLLFFFFSLSCLILICLMPPSKSFSTISCHVNTPQSICVASTKMFDPIICQGSMNSSVLGFYPLLYYLWLCSGTTFFPALATPMGVNLIFIFVQVRFYISDHLLPCPGIELPIIFTTVASLREGTVILRTCWFAFGLWYICVKISRLTTCPATDCQEHSMCQMTQN